MENKFGFWFEDFEWEIMFAIVCCSVRKARDSFVFNQEAIGLDWPWAKSIRKAVVYASNRFRCGASNEGQQPPLCWWVKVNVDGVQREQLKGVCEEVSFKTAEGTGWLVTTGMWELRQLTLARCVMYNVDNVNRTIAKQ